MSQEGASCQTLNKSIQKGRRTPTFSPDKASVILEQWIEDIGDPVNKRYLEVIKTLQEVIELLNVIERGSD